MCAGLQVLTQIVGISRDAVPGVGGSWAETLFTRIKAEEKIRPKARLMARPG